MGRALRVIQTEADRAVVLDWATKAPIGTRVTFQRSKRSLDQNSRMWAMLTDVATQTEHMGRRYDASQWKVLFLHACGREVQFLPALDGSTFIPWGQSSSDLSKDEMSELIDFIAAWGAEHNIAFHEPQQATEAAA